MKLNEFCNTFGVTGYEDKIIKKLSDEIKKNINIDFYYDNIGNLICLKKGKETSLNKQKIMITAHIDEVGLQIIEIKDKRKIKFKKLGNIKSECLFQQRVMFEDESIGIICGENIAEIKNNTLEKMYINLIKENTEIKIGDVCTFLPNYYEHENIIVSKALDNRVGCYILEKLLSIDIDNNNDLYFVFTTQEEFGLKGAKVALTSIKPDIFISIDVTPEGENNNIILSKGAAIKVSDSISIGNRKLINQFKEIATQNRIKYQLEISNCGTTEIALVNESGIGSKNVAISIPCREMHSANSIINKVDLESGYNLLKKYIEKYS